MEELLIGNDPFGSGIVRRGDIRRFDGTGNHTDPILRTIGGVGTRFRRITPVGFADGLQEPTGSDRPSARVVSNAVGAQEGELTNDRFMTDFIWNFGQFVNHDTDLALEGAEDPQFIAGNRDIEFPIPIPDDDPVFGPNGTNPIPGGRIPLRARCVCSRNRDYPQQRSRRGRQHCYRLAGSVYRLRFRSRTRSRLTRFPALPGTGNAQHYDNRQRRSPPCGHRGTNRRRFL